jgi:hypothetical protein
MQVRHQHEAALNINVRRKEESILFPDVFSIRPEPLQPLARPVSHNQFWVFVTIIKPGRSNIFNAPFRPIS